MYTRKLQSTGGSSLSLIIPKKWAKKNNLKDKDLIKITEFKNGGIYIDSINNINHFSSYKLIIKPSNFDQAKRLIYSCYSSGVNNLKINWENLSNQQKNQISNIIKNLIGWEIDDKNNQQLSAIYAIDNNILPANKIMRRLFSISQDMLYDTFTALLRRDINFAKEIINRDDQADKYNIFIARLFFCLISGQINESSTGVSITKLFYYHKIANNLERICDHSTKIVTYINDSNISIKTLMCYKKSAQSLIKIIKMLQELVFYQTDNQQQIIQKFNQINKLYNNSNIEANIIIQDSLNRIYDYIENIIDNTTHLNLFKY